MTEKHDAHTDSEAGSGDLQQREFDARMAKARAAQPPLPDTLDGMELGNRLLDYDPDTWSPNGRFQVEDLQRGEIISLVDPADAARQGEDSITKARPRHFVVLGVSGTGSMRDLTLWNLEADGADRVVSVPTVWPVMIRLDLVYLDDVSTPDPRATPEAVQPVQPVAPINTGSTEPDAWMELGQRVLEAMTDQGPRSFPPSFLPSEPVGIAEHLRPAAPDVTGTLPIVRHFPAATRPADDTAVKYRGVPVPGHLLGDWPDSQDSLAWRAGVNDTLRELGMAEVLPLHLRPVAQESVAAPLRWCGDRSTHGIHGIHGGNGWQCPGSV